MTYLQRLAIPLTLGVLAGGINWITVKQQLAVLEPHEYIMISEEIKAGDAIDKDKLVVFTLKADKPIPGLVSVELLESIPGQFAQNHLAKGAILASRDIAIASPKVSNETKTVSRTTKRASKP